MMDKKSANGLQTKVSEGGVQRKQLPYSVETPYGFHLDLDFLKYVDDIEKGNTIKRVHIQRRIKGPPKFSTLPRNFSLPGHGIRPAPRETAWSGTSTLGPKPKSRVTEVQQIFDIRPGEGGTPGQSGRVTPSQGYVTAKPREEVGSGGRDAEDKNVGIQNRPNLLRASSMPITLQQRKGSDSSSPDRTVGTPESGSTENMFRASPEITERRCVPQDRTGLHQQITVALKRVRELEEQVKTIPELKAQICSLREEREQLLRQIQAQAQAQVSTSSSASSDSRMHTKPQGQRPPEGLNLVLTTQPTSSLDASATGRDKFPQPGVTEQESKKQTHPSDFKKQTLEGPLKHTEQQILQNTEGWESKPHKEAEISSVSHRNAATEGKFEESVSTEKLRERLAVLEAKLSQASQELERTNNLLKEQLEANKVKEDKILQLSEGVRVEVLSPEFDNRLRRESIDAGTETEKVNVANQETETESPGTVDQGTDTDRICIEVCLPMPRAGSSIQETEANTVQTQERMTEMETELVIVSPPRPRANSMERGTVTERIPTHDQMTETPVTERVNQVTETEGETVTNHPHRPRASSVDRGTETERVNTVDRVTETEVAQRTDQQTGTETDRRPHNNPGRSVDVEVEVREVGSEVVGDAGTVVGEREEDEVAAEVVQRDRGEERVRMDVQVVAETSNTAVETKVERIVVLDVSKDEDQIQESVTEADKAAKVEETNDLERKETKAEGESAESKVEEDEVVNVSERNETIVEKDEVKDMVETQEVAPEPVEKKQLPQAEIVHAVIKETVVTETAVVQGEKAVVPVRPQRGRKPSVEQVQPLPPQPQAAPVRPRRGSSEAQKSQTPTKPEAQAGGPSQLESPTPAQVQDPQVKETPSLTQVEEQPVAVKSFEEKPSQPQPQAETKSPSPVPIEVQMRPKSIQTQPLAQTTAAHQDSKELKTVQKGSRVSQPASQVPAEAQTQPARQASSDIQPQVSRRSSGEAQRPSKETSETQILRQGSTETVQRRGSGETKASRRNSGESQTQSKESSETQILRKGSTETVQRRGSGESKASRRDSGESQPQSKESSETQILRKGSTETVQRRATGETKALRRDSGESQPPRRGSGDMVLRRGSSEAQALRKDTVDAHPTRRGSGETSLRRGSSEAQATRKDSIDAQPTRRDSGETAQRRGSSESQASRKDSGEGPRRGSSESPTSPAALGQVVTRLTGLLGEQWAQLGSGSGAQQTAGQQESTSTQKQTAGKKAEAGKGATAKPAGKAAPAASTGKPAGKPGPSKMSTIQSQLVSSLSVLSAFYSPSQKASAASKQQEQGLKSIMKKNGVADKQGNKGAKKNLKFVGVNGGYETTSSEESSGDEKSKVEVEEEEEDSSEPEVEKEEEKETEPQKEKPEEGAESQQPGEEAAAEGGAAVAAEKEVERGLLDPDDSQLLDDPAEREKVDKGFLDACVYVKDRMEEVSSPDKEMRQVLVVLYKEWFKVSSQKDSQADTVRLYLRQVGLTTPTLLPYVVNLTDGNGNMALHYSVSHSNFPVVKLLLDTGLCETDNVNKAGYTPVMLAALTAAESPDDLEVAQQLLRLGDVDACSRQAGQTALMLAVSHGRVAMVKLLLSCGADVNAQDREGSTALMCASEHGHTHIVRLLLETGRCDTSLTDKNDQTALSVAEGASHKEIVDLLKAYAEPLASSTTGLL